jgi:hypothetical protein
MRERAGRGTRLLVGAVGLALALGIVLYLIYR